MPKKICNDTCECHKCKTKRTKSKTKLNKKKMKPSMMPNITLNMTGMTTQPNITVPSQFNTPKDILDIKNSLIELLQKEKKKLSGVISIQTEYMREIVDDMATESALENVSEFRPFKRENKLLNQSYPPQQMKLSNTFLSAPAPPPLLPKKYNAFHSETFDEEIPNQIVTSLEKHTSQKPNIFLSETNPITTGNAILQEKFRPVSITILQKPIIYKADKPNIFESNPITTGNAFVQEKFRPAPVTVYHKPIKYNSNKPNIFVYEDDEDYGRPQEDSITLTPIKKYGKSEAQQTKETRILNYLQENVETQRGMVERGHFTHTNTRPDKEWITPEK